MSSKVNILITGATGYIGGSLLVRLLSHPEIGRFRIKAIIRNADKAALLASKFPQVVPIVGSTDDSALLESAAAEADVVFSTSNCDDVPAAEAILRGLHKRHEVTGTTPIIIHTSGAAIVADMQAMGIRKAGIIYDDSDAAQIATIHPEQPHRPVDLIIEAADAAGYLKSYIVVPSLVFGLASGPLVDIGFQHHHSLLIPAIIKLAIKSGVTKSLGEGVNTWNFVHVEDLAKLYPLILDSALSGSGTAGHGREGYYFPENGEAAARDIYTTVARALFELGKVSSLEVTPFTEAEIAQNPMLAFLGSSSRVKGTRTRALGWKPKYTIEDMLAGLSVEAKAIVEQPERFAGGPLG